MLVDRETLKDYLVTNNCRDPEGALAPFERLFQMAETDEYPLVSAEAIDQENLMKAVSLATDRLVSKVMLISHTDFLPMPGWLVEEFKKNLGACLGSSLWVIMRENSFKGKLRNEDLPCFFRNLDRSLLVTMNNLGLCDSDALTMCLRLSYSHGLGYYFGLCLLNDHEQIAKLKPLVELWCQCLPIGFKQDEPETLLVICK